VLWSPWQLPEGVLADGKRDALRAVVHEQERRGVDIVTDGEQTRQHFVTTFIEHLDGVDFDRRETVRIRNRYDASVPTVVGAVAAGRRCSSRMRVPARADRSPHHGLCRDR
jgi:5-methyltetrahydropteroyltriglutamate--homocysteine methyltransferase